jgi:hypothetical protein
VGVVDVGQRCYIGEGLVCRVGGHGVSDAVAEGEVEDDAAVVVCITLLLAFYSHVR